MAQQRLEPKPFTVHVNVLCVVEVEGTSADDVKSLMREYFTPECWKVVTPFHVTVPVESEPFIVRIVET